MSLCDCGICHTANCPERFAGEEPPDCDGCRAVVTDIDAAGTCDGCSRYLCGGCRADGGGFCEECREGQS